MTSDFVTELTRQAVMLTLMVSAPVLAIAVVVGLGVSVAQAVTQIQDQTVSIVPKLVIMLLTILFIMPWALAQMSQYSIDLFNGIPNSLN